MGGQWAGARELRHQLAREERVECSPGCPRDGDRAVTRCQPLARLIFTLLSALDRAAALRGNRENP